MIAAAERLAQYLRSVKPKDKLMRLEGIVDAKSVDGPNNQRPFFSYEGVMLINAEPNAGITISYERGHFTYNPVPASTRVTFLPEVHQLVNGGTVLVRYKKIKII